MGRHAKPYQPSDALIWSLSAVGVVLAIVLAYGCSLAVQRITEHLSTNTPETTIEPLEDSSGPFSPTFRVDPHRVTTTERS